MKLYKIKKSKIDNKGRGLYATRDIKEGTKIINYLGKIITNKEVDESSKFDNKKPIYSGLNIIQLNSTSALTCSLALSAKAFKSYPPSRIETTFPWVYLSVTARVFFVIS